MSVSGIGSIRRISSPVRPIDQHSISCFLQDDVDEYMSQSDNKSAETVLRHLEEQHNKYKFMEYNLTTKKSRSLQ